jgi:hypothetical protein
LSGDTCYSPQEYLGDVFQGIYGRFKETQPLTQYERLAQRTLANTLLLHADNKAVSLELSVKMTALLDVIAAKGRAAAAINKDALTAAHYRALADLIGSWKTNTREAYLR